MRYLVAETKGDLPVSEANNCKLPVGTARTERSEGVYQWVAVREGLQKGKLR